MFNLENTSAFKWKLKWRSMKTRKLIKSFPIYSTAKERNKSIREVSFFTCVVLKEPMALLQALF